jgi:demethylmenaquinone methyltransferase/2-methoxy-6-polyprenyl-1,4-benzoquinol methylase
VTESGSDADARLAEQVAYYRARAPEYDQWWRREGRYDLGDEFGASWEADMAEVRQALDDFAPSGDVLELAAGTGNWSVELARHADRLTLVDAAPETLAIAAGKLAGLDAAPEVEQVVADLFAWEPTRRYDVVFFSFWHSHVPRDRIEWFWDLVDRALVPGGRAFLLDNARPDASGLAGPGGEHAAERFRASAHGETHDPDDVESTRKLNDGREFRIVKVFWAADELQARLAELGWAFTLQESQIGSFLYGSGTSAQG